MLHGVPLLVMRMVLIYPKLVKDMKKIVKLHIRDEEHARRGT